MHLEVRKAGKRKKYFLAHSFRDKGKVRKIRRYLGADLKKEKLDSLKKTAERAIFEQLESYKRISDPLLAALSKTELEEIETLVAIGDVRIEHLSDKDWTRFTELFTYDTNAIEGSTVTQSEVAGILKKNIWPDKSKDEISETYGVSEAIKYIRKTKEHLSIELIKELHRIVFKNSKPFAGRFREEGVEVVVADSLGNILHRGAPQEHVAKLLKELAAWYDNNRKKYHPLLLAAVVHNQFENIHPFQDGNGRVGRLLLNNMLLKHNMPPVNIELRRRKEYYSALREYQNNGNIRPTIELILKEYRALKHALKKA